MRKKKKKRYTKQTTLVLLALLILALSVSLILIDIIKRECQETFYTFHDNKYSSKYVIRGVDVSHHNGNINWKQLKNEGVAFAYLKATEGVSHKDRNYKQNYLEAKLADIKVGMYHFYTFALDGELQAKHFIRHAKVASSDLIPVIDVEHSPTNIHSNEKAYRKIVVNELLKLEQTLSDYYGVHPIIYTNKDCYKLYIKGRFPENFIWLSDLHKEPKISDNEWVIWQFSHTGKLNGVVGNVDLNYFRYSYRQFNELLIP